MSRSLGVLTLDLVAKIGGFEAGLNQAARKSDDTLKKIQRSARGLGTALAAGFAALGASNVIGAVIRNTIEAEDALRQLEQRIKSTGGVAGVAAPELVAFAKQMQGVTTYGDDAIIAMQGLLLTFTNIRGQQVYGATEAILDLATAMGTDLNSAALQVGKALNDPVKGLSALGRAGIQFSDDQKKVIKALVDTGDIAGAQNLILQEMQTQFGGAARAASQTFGGAIEQLKNSFGDLLEADGGLGDATAAVHEFTALLKDPSTVQAAQTLTQGIITAFGGVAKAISNTVNVTRFLAEELAAAFSGPAADDIVRVREEIEKLEKFKASGNLARFWEEGIPGLLKDDAELEASLQRLRSLEKAYEDFSSMRPAGAPAGGAGGGGTGGGGGPAKSPLEEIRITIPKRELDSTARLMEEMHQKTRTQNEEQLRAYYEQKEALDFLWREGGIDNVEQYNARLDAINDKLLPEFEVTLKKLPEIAEKEIEELNEFQIAAARNTQGIIADTLTNGFDEGADGVLKSFADMIKQMVAQAVAADIAGRLFGEAGGGTSGSSGWIGALMGLFGARAMGGPVSAGTPYLVGERGPEVIVPRNAGTVVPNHALGGMNNSFNITIQAPNEQVGRLTANQAAAAMQRQLAVASRRNN